MGCFAVDSLLFNWPDGDDADERSRLPDKHDAAMMGWMLTVDMVLDEGDVGDICCCNCICCCWCCWLFELLVGEDGNEDNDENRMSGSKGCLNALGGLFCTSWLLLFNGELDTDCGDEGADAGDL